MVPIVMNNLKSVFNNKDNEESDNLASSKPATVVYLGFEGEGAGRMVRIA